MANADLSQQTAALIVEQLLQQAIEYHQKGQLQNAERLYCVVLQIQPNHSDAKYNLTLIGEQIKQVVADIPKYKAVLEADPTQGEHWQVYAEALLIAGQAEDAQLVIRTAQECGLDNTGIQVLQQRAQDALQDTHASNTSKMTQLSKPNIQTRFDDIGLVKQPKTKTTTIKNITAKRPKNISRFNSNRKPLSQNAAKQLITLFNAGLYIELEKQAHLLLNKHADNGFIWKVLGAAQQMQGKDALQALRNSTELLPNDSQAHSNLGAYLVEVRQFKAAETSCRRALQINTNSAAAYYNLGNAMLGRKKFDKALINYRIAIDIKEDYAEAYNNIGYVLTELNQIDDAFVNYNRALEINPNYAEVHNNLGNANKSLGQYDEAIENYRQSIAIKPDYAEAHYNLGNVLSDLGQHDQAVASFQQSINLRPDYADAYKNMGNSLLRYGKLNEAEISVRHALEIDPNDAMANSNLLFVLNYHPNLSAVEIYQAYQAYDAQNINPLRSTWQAHKNERNPDRRLRIGYVSPDFRGHACHLFLEPLLSHHDKAQMEVFAYAELDKEDEISNRFKNYVEHWISTKELSDEALTARIRDDSIDILIDLAGHTAGNRLLTFARKPAPVSLSWLGYGYTTGVSAIDYYLTDETSTPMDSDNLFAEQPLRISTPSYVYRPNPNMGPVNQLPALKNDYITFGSLTRAVRLNQHTIRVWSTLLKAVPNSRLIINSIDFNDPSMQAYMKEKFIEHGIASKRLEIGYQSPPWNVLRCIDIGLDCFPHNSGTTLFETLYMGIPYITLAGRPSVGRLGSSILQGAGHPEWIAESEQDYITKCIELSININLLSEIRNTLREQIEASALRDEKGFALKVEVAYRNIWKIWCKKGGNP